MNKRAKRQALVNSLRQITPEMRDDLRSWKTWGISESKRPDFVKGFTQCWLGEHGERLAEGSNMPERPEGRSHAGLPHHGIVSVQADLEG